MLYAKIDKETNTLLQWPITEEQLRKYLSSYSLPWDITAEDLANTPYVLVPPVANVREERETATKRYMLSEPTYNAISNKWERSYTLKDVPESEIESRKKARWDEILTRRKRMLRLADELVNRALREERLGLSPTVPIAALDDYMQTLADFTTTYDDPFEIEWPLMPGANIR